MLHKCRVTYAYVSLCLWLPVRHLMRIGKQNRTMSRVQVNKVNTMWVVTPRIEIAYEILVLHSSREISLSPLLRLRNALNLFMGSTRLHKCYVSDRFLVVVFKTYTHKVITCPNNK